MTQEKSLAKILGNNTEGWIGDLGLQNGILNLSNLVCEKNLNPAGIF